ncbi:MAG: DUF3990 domain-containing protein [Clostridiales bacterium]|jgi:hypothetical protein|nr:DUF3990 domain-containing protein [Clostridiales bacterium]
MRLYHGSNAAIETPKLLHQQRGLDFGAGFYLTSSRAQAERFSFNVARRAGEGAPTVSVYEFDAEVAERKLDALHFNGADYDWLAYVRDNRLKQYAGREYDIVIGAVANDDVLPTILLYINGQLDADLTIGALKTRKLVDQYCFKTEAALAFLNFQGAEVAAV